MSERMLRLTPRWVFPILTLGFACSVLALVWLQKRGLDAEAPAERYAYLPPAPSGELPKLWQAPTFTFTDQRGAQVSLASLRGQPWIADFIFTECTNVCPMLTSRLVLLQRALRGVNARFVSFSVDPKHDTPAVLAEYARRWNAAEARWSLLSTDEKRLPDTMSGFRVTAEASGDPANPIVHSNVFMLVDADGFVRGVYASDDEQARARLIADVRTLAAAPPVPSPPDAASAVDASLYTSLGCGGCHADRRLAPPLMNLLGTERMLADGKKLVIDEAYLRRSILEPAADIVVDYANLMPSYARQLSEEQLTRLLRELGERRAAPVMSASAASAAVRLVEDPVCHMQVRTESDARKATHAGHDYYFCSDSCRTAFLGEPGKFAPR